jgi:hypothetical protein
VCLRIAQGYLATRGPVPVAAGQTLDVRFVGPTNLTGGYAASIVNTR